MIIHKNEENNLLPKLIYGEGYVFEKAKFVCICESHNFDGSKNMKNPVLRLFRGQHKMEICTHSVSGDHSGLGKYLWYDYLSTIVEKMG